MPSIAWASLRYMQELATILAPQHLTQGSCALQYYEIYFFIFTQNRMKFIIHSQSIRKLKPKNSPRMPPQSATRESAGNAITSFRTKIMSFPKTGFNVLPPTSTFSPVTCIRETIKIVKKKQ